MRVPCPCLRVCQPACLDRQTVLARVCCAGAGHLCARALLLPARAFPVPAHAIRLAFGRSNTQLL